MIASRSRSRSLRAGLSCVFLGLSCTPCDDGCPTGWFRLPRLQSVEPVKVTIDGTGLEPITCTWNGAWECVPRPRSHSGDSPSHDTFVYNELGQKNSYLVHLEGPLGAIDSSLVLGSVIREQNSCECNFQTLNFLSDDFLKVGAIPVPLK